MIVRFVFVLGYFLIKIAAQLLTKNSYFLHQYVGTVIWIYSKKNEVQNIIG